MKIDLKSKRVMVIDNGLFPFLALRLARDFGEVSYYTPYVRQFPVSNDLLVGDGFEQIKRLKSIWNQIDETDLFVFPDTLWGDVQEHLVALGKRVFGGRSGEECELYRNEFKSVLKSIGLPVKQGHLITGLDNLREFLKKNDDKYVKTSLVRGDFETFYAQNYELIEPRLDDLENSLGPKKKIYEFVVDDSIDGLEIGYDGFCINGEFPPIAMIGYEAKDIGAVTAVKKRNEMPDFIEEINDKLSPILKAYNYRGFLSNEIRVDKKGVAWLTDPCFRMPSPIGEIEQEIYGNLAEIIWFGAEGIMVPPEPIAKFAVQATVSSEWCDTHFQAVEFPQDNKQIKFFNACRIEGKVFTIPVAEMVECGSVIGLGDTVLEAFQDAVKTSKLVEGHKIKIIFDGFDDTVETIRKGEEQGIHFADELPTAEQIAETLGA